MGCGFYEPVEVTEISGFTDIQWREGKLTGLLEVRVYNPNWYALSATDSQVDLFMDEVLIGHCTLGAPVRVPADASADVALRLESAENVLGTVLEAGFKNLFGSLLKGGEAPANIVHATGTVTGKRWLFEHEILLNYTDTLQLH